MRPVQMQVQGRDCMVAAGWLLWAGGWVVKAGHGMFWGWVGDEKMHEIIISCLHVLNESMGLCAMKNLQVRLSPSQSEEFDRAVVRLAVKLARPASAQDLVRAWVDAGCPMEQSPRCGPQASQTASAEPPRIAGLPVVEKERAPFLKAGGKLL